MGNMSTENNDFSIYHKKLGRWGRACVRSTRYGAVRNAYNVVILAPLARSTEIPDKIALIVVILVEIRGSRDNAKKWQKWLFEEKVSRSCCLFHVPYGRSCLFDILRKEATQSSFYCSNTAISSPGSSSASDIDPLIGYQTCCEPN